MQRFPVSTTGTIIWCVSIVLPRDEAELISRASQRDLPTSMSMRSLAEFSERQLLEELAKRRTNSASLALSLEGDPERSRYSLHRT
jgi:hypothetical protein